MVNSLSKEAGGRGGGSVKDKIGAGVGALAALFMYGEKIPIPEVSNAVSSLQQKILAFCEWIGIPSDVFLILLSLTLFYITLRFLKRAFEIVIIVGWIIIGALALMKAVQLAGWL